MLMRIFNAIKNNKPSYITPLGRWTIHDNLNHTKLKIDYSNEDHCGTCAEYIIEKKNKKEQSDQEEEYYKYMISESIPDVKNNK